MIISKTPFRVSFFGGGTDYPAWYLQEGGAVLSTTIDKYCYISCRTIPPFFNLKHRIVWSHIETVNSISEILHPAVREGLRYLGFDDSVGLEIHHQGDLPARTGMGSSSSFAAGLIKTLYAMRGKTIDKHELALKAIELEQDILKDRVGSQDQVAVSYGGFNCIQFYQNGSIHVDPVSISPAKLEELQNSLLLIYTGTSRLASEVAQKVIGNLQKKRGNLLTMRKMVDQAHDLLTGNRPISHFGRLLHESWLLKRDLCQDVSNPQIDSIYQTAIESGALGGKLLGAGSNGFMVFFVPPDKQSSVLHNLSGYLHVPFRFENEGCSLVYTNSSSAKPECVAAWAT